MRVWISDFQCGKATNFFVWLLSYRLPDILYTCSLSETVLNVSLNNNLTCGDNSCALSLRIESVFGA